MRIANAADIVKSLIAAQIVEETRGSRDPLWPPGLKLTLVGQALVATHGQDGPTPALSCMTIPGLFVEEEAPLSAVAPPSVFP